MSALGPAVARLTPAGIGGVAVLALQPGAAQEQLALLLGRELPAPGAIVYGTLTPPNAEGDSAPIDEVLVIGRPAGVVEVHLHGSPAVVEEVIDAIGGAGATARGRRRLEERAAIAAAQAPTDLGARILLDQSSGALRAELAGQLHTTPDVRARTLVTMVARGRRLLRLLTPANVVLVGPVNAGKSTLFNVLAGEDVATVTDVPGTTRDALGVPARLGPWPVVLVDTAGERSLAAEILAGDRSAQIERAGQELARSAAARADLVFALWPVGETPLESPLETPVEASGLLRASAPPVHRLRTQAAPTLGLDPGAWGPNTISALEAPEHARSLVAAAVAAQVDPGPLCEPLWSPGRAVPFEAVLIDALEEVARGGQADRSALASLVDAL